MNLLSKLSKGMQNLKSNNFLKWVFIPVLLLVLWLGLSMSFSSYKSFTVLQFTHTFDENFKSSDFKLLKDQKITGKFIANEDDLGIVAIKIGEVPKIDFNKEDILIFRIREVNKDEWLFQNTYKTGSFTPNKYFPFGFQSIINSKGKSYEFELVSNKGNEQNAVEIKNKNTKFISKYKKTKNEIFSTSEASIDFIEKKLITFFSNLDVLFSSAIFILPLIYYYAWLFITLDNKLSKKHLIIAKYIFSATVFLTILLGIFYTELSTVGYTIGLIGLWILLIIINKYKSRDTFYLAFFLIGMSIFSIYIDLGLPVDKISSFAYFLIVIGFLQIVGETKRLKSKN